MSNLSTPPATTEHDLLWNDRLQDWLDRDCLDGGTSASDLAGVESHLAECAICQAQLAEFEQLDTALQMAAPAISLGADFDARLFSQIDALDDSSRAAARQRLEQEMRDNLQTLARGWRQGLAYVIPGVVAGIALALALVGWLNDSGVSQQLASEGAQELGRQAGSYVQMLVTAIVGAGIGAGVAGWLSSATD